MGQKVNPVAFRTGITEDWKSRWYAPKKEFATLLVEDQKIRSFVAKRPYNDRDGRPIDPAIARVEIERTRDEVRVVIRTGRSGIMIGNKGEKSEELKNQLQKLTGRKVNLVIEDVKRPELVADRKSVV